MPESLVTKRINTLTVDSIALGLGLPVDSLYLQNVYVDVDDTHIRTAAFNFYAALVNGSTTIDLPASTIGSIYHLQLLSAGAQVLSVFFAMPTQDALLSELSIYTAYPPREGYPLQSPLWGEIEGSIENQTDLAQTFMSKGDGTALSEAVQLQISQGQQVTDQSIATIDGRVTGVDDKLKLLFVTSATPKLVNGVTIPAGTYLDVQTHVAKESITGDKIAKNADLNTPNITNPTLLSTHALTTLAAPNLYLASNGMLARSNDPLNAASRKVGTAAGNLVERGADGYPTKNNAIGAGQTWQDMTASRAKSTTYTNTTGRPITVSVSATGSQTSVVLRVWLYIDSVPIVQNACYVSPANVGSADVTTVIPSDSTYRFEAYATANTAYVTQWSELR